MINDDPLAMKKWGRGYEPLLNREVIPLCMGGEMVGIREQ